MQYNTISTNYILLHGIIRLDLDPNPSRRRFRTARPRGEIDLRRGQRHLFRRRILLIPRPLRRRQAADRVFSRRRATSPPSPRSPWRMLGVAPSRAAVVVARADRPQHRAAMVAAGQSASSSCDLA